MNTGLLAAFGTLLCWTAGTFAFTEASRQSDPGVVNRVRLFCATILLGIIVITFFGLPVTLLFTLPTFHEWFWLGLSGLIGLTIGDFFSFHAYRILGSSRSSLFNTFAPIAALLLGMTILGESINAIGAIGMLISLAGIIWFIRATQLSREDKSIDRKHLIQGILFAITGAVGQGLGLVCAKKGLNFIHTDGPDLSPVHATWIRMGVATLGAYSVAVFKRNVFSEFKTTISSAQKFKPLIAGTLFGPVTGVSLSLLAASQLQVGIAQTIFSLQPLTVMFVAYVIGKEKLNLPSVIAALVSMIGVFILVWRDDLNIW